MASPCGALECWPVLSPWPHGVRCRPHRHLGVAEARSRSGESVRWPGRPSLPRHSACSVPRKGTTGSMVGCFSHSEGPVVPPVCWPCPPARAGAECGGQSPPPDFAVVSQSRAQPQSGAGGAARRPRAQSSGRSAAKVPTQLESPRHVRAEELTTRWARPARGPMAENRVRSSREKLSDPVPGLVRMSPTERRADR